MGSTTTPSAFSPLTGYTPNRRRFLQQLGALGLGAATLGVAGCSNFSGGSNGSTTADTFTWTFWGTGAEKTAVSAVVDSYVAGKKLTAKAQSIPDSYETKLNTLLAANTPPDAGYLTQGMAMRLGEQGKIVNVLGQSGYDAFLPGTIHRWAPGKAVSQTAIEVFALWYASDVTKAAGVKPPASVSGAWNWDQFVQAADKLTKDTAGKHPSQAGFNAASVAQYGVAAPTGFLPLTALLKSNGVDFFNAAGTKTNLDDPAAIKVISDVADLIFKHRVSPTPAQASTFGASTALLLASKRVAMAIDGTWAMLDLAQSKVPYDVAVLPKYQQYFTTNVSGANGVFTGSKHQDVGLGLLLALADPKQVPLFASGLWLPLTKNYYTDDALIDSWIKNSAHPASFRTAVVDATLNNTVAYPAFRMKNFSIIETTVNNGLTPMFTKQGDIAAQCKALAGQINKLLQGAYPDDKDS